LVVKQVGIFVVAQNISDSVVQRFQGCLEKSNPTVSYDVFILRTQKKEKHFNKSKLLNKGIKTLAKGQYEVLIQTDIDLIIPPGLVDHSYEIAKTGRVCFHNDMRKVNIDDIPGFPKLPSQYAKIDWSIFKKVPFIFASGCWNTMQSPYWWDTGGWNEMMIEWGREDDDWRNRAKKHHGIKFIDSKKFELIHYNHPPRTKDLRCRNDAKAKEAAKKGISSWI
jgi:hypothetical protein